MKIEKVATENVCWLLIGYFSINVALELFQPHRDLKAEDNQSLKS